MSMFNSGWRFQHWSEAGKTLGGRGEHQTTAADQTVASGAGGSVLIETDDWKKLTRGDAASPAPETRGIGGMINQIVFSEALLVGLMQAANARLVEIDSAAGFVGSSDPNASVADWEEADAAPAHADAASEN